ncbi:MAG: putative transcriptional regulator [Candidatus Jettenia ecosi]|uniref:Putative transcriptional regulator n=1 Tax=Candidatus Jettenia ecosi TaxID=2494326 RepID=A0A533Q5P5_9BACT|nr:MAG: putative transcriptional regulator [Candidatus Jettenia ecosi]
MKVKKFKIGIKSVKEVLDDFVKTGKSIERGEEVKKEKTIYFESIKGFRKAITPKRIELLHLIREKHPKSIQELARIAKRDIKSIVTDISILAELGLIDIKRKKDGRKESMPVVDYNRISLEIAV